VPVAVNCWLPPIGTIGLAGVRVMEVRVEGFTVRVVLPEIVPEVAVIIAVTVETGGVVVVVARPLLLTVATDVSDELQVTCVVIS
jgi:hypothetical protein